MKTVSLFPYIFFILLLSACSGKQSANGENAMAAAKEEAAEETNTNTTLDIINDYIKLKDALVASDSTQAQKAAVAMLEVIDAVKMIDIQQNTKEVAASTNLAIQRTYFDSLSAEVYKLAKETDVDIPLLYWQYCPMAFENKGAYWLSFQQEIKNPYFGSQMLTCGRVEEEIK